MAQAAVESISTVMISPFCNFRLVNVLLFVPVVTPFTFHVNVGFEPPLTAVALNVTELPVQTDWSVALIVTAGATLDTFMMSGLLVALGLVTQLAFEVMTTVTISPSVSEVEVNVLLSVPTLTLFTFHWYEGSLPPLTGVAVNVTEEPRQIFRLLAEMESSGVRLLVLIFTWFDVTTELITQLALDFNCTVTISP